MSSPLSMASNPAAPFQKRDFRWWITRILLGLLALIATVAIGVLVAGAIAKASLYARFPPTGQLVDVGGYRLHIACQGSSAGPTVILDAGSGATSLDWTLVQPQVSTFARVCAYDRAGIGWSEASPKPRSAPVMVEELHALLEKANLKGPFVFVGHSVGGIVSRQYAASYPSEVSGLVLVDSAYEDQFRRYPEPVVAATARAVGQFRLLETLIALGVPALFPSLAPLEPRLPKPIAEAYRALTISNPKHVAAGRGEIEALMRGETKPVTTLGNLPLVVLSRGRPDPGMYDPGVAPEVVAQAEQVWSQMQLELTALSSRGRRIVAQKSGHSIQLDQPELVIGAIREVRAAKR
jgi:pimeloyl-ACP methyl ester carboxylesterase